MSHAVRGGALAFAAAASAWGQTTTYQFGCRQTYVVSPPTGLQWASVTARQFAHTWYRSNVGNAYRVRPGEGPNDPPMQSGTFAFYGVDQSFGNGQISNSCVSPCTWPRFGDWARTKDTAIGPGGGSSTLDGSMPSLITAQAVSGVSVPAYAVNGAVQVNLSTSGAYQTMYVPPVVSGYSKAYAFSGAELRTGVIPPAPAWTFVSVASWQLGSMAMGVTLSPTPPPPTPTYPTVRLWDPLRYRVENLSTGEMEERSLLSIAAEVWSEGEVGFTPAVGLRMQSADCLFEMEAGGPGIEPSGRFRVRIVGGVVSESEATGVFSSASAPPVGTPGPVFVPDLPVGLDFLVDVGRATGPTVATFMMDHAGLDPSVTPCPADLNFDGVVDFNDLLEFLNLYVSEDPRADLNEDGVVDFNDFLEYLNQYNLGC